MRRRSWTERQLGGVPSDGGDDHVDCEEADNDDGCGGEAVDDGEAVVFQKSCRRIACCAAPGVSRDILLFRQVQKSINQRDTVLKKVDV